MPVESIKLSPKKNGKGYVSSYSVSISSREAQECSLVGKPVIKIIDSNSGEIIAKKQVQYDPAYFSPELGWA